MNPGHPQIFKVFKHPNLTINNDAKEKQKYQCLPQQRLFWINYWHGRNDKYERGSCHHLLHRDIFNPLNASVALI